MVQITSVQQKDSGIFDEWYISRSSITSSNSVYPLMDSECDDRNASWVFGEIKPGQEERYLEWLKKWSHDQMVLQQQLEDCCHLNLTAKFSILCSHLTEIGIGLNLAVMTTNSCLFFATGSKSREVSQLIIKAADKSLLKHSVEDSTIYAGCTALHCAVANDMPEVIDDLFMKLNNKDIEELLGVHLKGTYFTKTLKVSSLALHVACWNGNVEIFEKLVYHGAAVDAQDYPDGNTILHVLVKLGLHHPEAAKKTFKEVLSCKASRMWFCLKNNQDLADWTAQDDINFKTHMLYLENDDGFTPLTLAARIGAHSMIDFIVNIEGVHRNTMWKFGQVAFAGYDLNEVDPVMAQRSCKMKSNVMDLLIYQSLNIRTLPIFSLPLIQNWVESKWKYYRWNFHGWFFFHILFMVSSFQLPMTFFRESQTMKEKLNNTDANATQITFGAVFWECRQLQFYLVVLCGMCCVTLSYEIWELFLCLLLMVARLTRKIHNKMYNAPMQVILKLNIFRGVLIAGQATQTFAIIRLCFYSEVCTFNTAMAFVFGCYFFIFFLQGCNGTGYFGTIMHYVLFSDIVSFGIVFLIMLFAFGGTMTLVLFNQNHDVIGYDHVGASMFTMFNYMQGFGMVSYFKKVVDNRVVIAVFALFVCLTMILLLNMLIAAMSETYAKLAPYKDLISTRNRAAVILMMERRSFEFIVKRFNSKMMHYDEVSRKLLFFVQTSQPGSGK